MTWTDPRDRCWPGPINWLINEDLFWPVLIVLMGALVGGSLLGIEFAGSTTRTTSAVVLAKSWHPDDRRTEVAPTVSMTSKGMTPGFAVVSSGSAERFTLLLMVDGKRMSVDVWQDMWAAAAEGQRAEVVVRTGGLGGESVRTVRLIDGGVE